MTDASSTKPPLSTSMTLFTGWLAGLPMLSTPSSSRPRIVTSGAVTWMFVPQFDCTPEVKVAAMSPASVMGSPAASTPISETLLLISMPTGFEPEFVLVALL